MIGELNKGWTMAKALLGFERIFLGSPKQSQVALNRLALLGRAKGLFEDERFRERFTSLRLDVADLAETYGRFVNVLKRGEDLGPDVSILKIFGNRALSTHYRRRWSNIPTNRVRSTRTPYSATTSSMCWATTGSRGQRRSMAAPAKSRRTFWRKPYWIYRRRERTLFFLRGRRSQDPSLPSPSRDLR